MRPDPTQTAPSPNVKGLNGPGIGSPAVNRHRLARAGDPASLHTTYRGDIA